MKKFITAILAATAIFVTGTAATPTAVVHADPPYVVPQGKDIPVEVVREVQAALTEYGYYAPVDGAYGPITLRAVLHWQRVNGLLQDGIAGPITRRTLEFASTGEDGTPAYTDTPTDTTTPIDELPPAVPAPTTTTTTTTVPAATSSGPPQPTNGDCDSWRPLLEYYELPWSLFERILKRESNCTNAHAYDNDDHSHGGLQVNRLGANMSNAWDGLGFDHDYMHTATGAIHAAGVLYKRCGFGPWNWQYNCGFPNGAVSRWDWPNK